MFRVVGRVKHPSGRYVFPRPTTIQRFCPQRCCASCVERLRRGVRRSLPSIVRDDWVYVALRSWRCVQSRYRHLPTCIAGERVGPDGSWLPWLPLHPSLGAPVGGTIPSFACPPVGLRVRRTCPWVRLSDTWWLLSCSLWLRHCPGSVPGVGRVGFGFRTSPRVFRDGWRHGMASTNPRSTLYVGA